MKQIVEKLLHLTAQDKIKWERHFIGAMKETFRVELEGELLEISHTKPDFMFHKESTSLFVINKYQHEWKPKYYLHSTNGEDKDLENLFSMIQNIYKADIAKQPEFKIADFYNKIKDL